MTGDAVVLAHLGGVPEAITVVVPLVVLAVVLVVGRRRRAEEEAAAALERGGTRHSEPDPGQPGDDVSS